MTLDITVTDMFCGAGGSTTGAVLAGATVQLAINHWRRAIETHNTNYPETVHVLTDLHTASPRRFSSTTGLVASPECTSHSLAKGRKRVNQGQIDLWADEEADFEAEAEERSRCTMWTPLDWAEYHDYQFVVLENVVDTHLWRPFPAWLQAWRSLGYEYELVYFNSMFAHPTPQSRDRMYFVAWKRGNRKPDLRIQPRAFCPKCERDIASVQSWKKPQRKYGKYKQQYVYRCPECTREVTPYYYAAANAIDWSLPAPRIGDRKRPLHAKTLQRIAHGLEKFAAREQPPLPSTSHNTALFTQTTRQDLALITPFLLNLNHPEVRPLAVGEQPFPTQTAYDATGITIPSSIAELSGGSRAHLLTEALATMRADGHHHRIVVSPFLMDHLGEYRPRDIKGPFSTVCASGNHHSLIVPPAYNWLMTYYNNGQLAPTYEAAPTVTTLDRHALVTSEVHAHGFLVEECGFRMLVPAEIQAAMAFPDTYILTGTRREQVKQLGNAVTPPVMKLLIERVVASLY